MNKNTVHIIIEEDITKCKECPYIREDYGMEGTSYYCKLIKDYTKSFVNPNKLSEYCPFIK